MTISRRHLLSAAAVGAATAVLPVPAWSERSAVLTLADHSLRATFPDALIVREPAQLLQAADWLVALPNRTLTGLLNDADGVLLMQWVPRGATRWLWSAHHRFKGAPSSAWLRAKAHNLATLDPGPANAGAPGAATTWFSFVAQS